MMRYKNLSFWLSTLSIIGAFALHVYLTVLHYELKLGMQTIDSACNVSSRLNCQSALASPYSEFMGSPLTIWALGLHLLLIGFLFSYKFPVIGLGSPPVARWMARGLSVMVGMGSLVMLAISVLAMNTYCPMCIALYVLSFFTLVFTFLATREEKAEAPDLKIFRKWIVYCALGLMVVGWLAGRILLQNHAGPEFQNLVRGAVTEWQHSRPQPTPDVKVAFVGPEDAPIVITEFADFLCGFCKNAAQRLNAFYSSRPDVRFNFVSFPLDGECNSEVSRASGLSCRISYIAQCSFEQTQDLSAHEWIFERQERFNSRDALETLIAEMSVQLGLDLEGLKSCVDGPEVQELVRNQAEMGHRWGVQATPTVFVNSKRLPSGPMIPYLEAIYAKIKAEN